MRSAYFVLGALGQVAKAGVVGSRIEGLFGVSLYRSSIYLMLTLGGRTVLGLLFWVVAARLYPAASTGIASAAIAAIGLIGLLSTLGLDYGLIRFLPQSGARARDLMNSCFTIGGLLSLVITTVFLLGLPIWAPALLHLRDNPVFFATVVVSAVASTLITFVVQTFVAQRRTGFVLAQALILGLARFGMLVGLAGVFEVFGVFSSWGVAILVALGVSMFVFLPRTQAGYRPRPAVDRRLVADMIRFSLGNYGANLFLALPGFALPLFVINLVGPAASAYYYIAWAIASVLLMIPGAISLSLFAEGSHDSRRQKQDVGRSLKLIMFVLVPAMAVVFLAGDKILLVFGADYSENATRLLWVLAASALPAGINHIYFSTQRVAMKMGRVLGPAVLVTVATLGLSYLLLPGYGIIGAGISWLVAQSMVTLLVAPRLFRMMAADAAG